MNKGKVFIIVISLLFIIQSCKNNVSGPGPVFPGSRDYTWTADTINVPVMTLIRLWGDSYDNMWSVGFGGGSEYQIWHFDGSIWSTDSTPRRINPIGLYGFGKNNIWMSNYNSTMWHYDGSSWSKYCEYEMPGYDDVSFNGFYGNSPSDIYAVGMAAQMYSDSIQAVIMHYNGKDWTFVDIPFIKVQLASIARDINSGLYFITGVRFNKYADTSYIFKFDGRNISKIFSGIYATTLGNIDKEICFIIEQKIYKYGNGSLYVWKDFTGTDYGGRALGWSDKDFFYGAHDGIGHYNGTDLKTLFKTDAFLMAGEAVPGNVFFIAKDFTNGANIFIRGKLNK